MSAKPSNSDLGFKSRFEAGDVKPCGFGHRDHLRLVYVYLCESDTKMATDRVRRSLQKFLKDNDIPASKFHETLTVSWTQAVKHFMARAGLVSSFDEFMAADNRLLDAEIMLAHYRRETLFSDQAPRELVVPDIQPIPQHP